MRSISISTDTYAAIWAARQPGEDSEEEILRRLLSVPAKSFKAGANNRGSDKIGFRDPRFGIELREGFEIFRTYLGTSHRATAKGGRWLLESTGRSYPSLNQLSQAIGAKTENAWINWYFTGEDGKRQLIDSLRNRSGDS